MAVALVASAKAKLPTAVEKLPATAVAPIAVPLWPFPASGPSPTAVDLVEPVVKALEPQAKFKCVVSSSQTNGTAWPVDVSAASTTEEAAPSKRTRRVLRVGAVVAIERGMALPPVRSQDHPAHTTPNPPPANAPLIPTPPRP